MQTVSVSAAEIQQAMLDLIQLCTMTFSDWNSLNYWLTSEQHIRLTERSHTHLFHSGTVILCVVHVVKSDVLCFIAFVVFLMLTDDQAGKHRK